MAQFSALTRAERTGELQHFLEDAGLRRRKSQGHRPKGKIGARIPRLCRGRRGHDGYSTRFAFKILSQVFNFDHSEVAANPVHLLYVLEKQIAREHLPQEVQDRYLGFLKEYLAHGMPNLSAKSCKRLISNRMPSTVRTFLTAMSSYADYWIQDQEYRDPDTGEMMDRAGLNEELEKIEKPAGISNPKDFRNEIVNFRVARAGQEPRQQSALDELRESYAP